MAALDSLSLEDKKRVEGVFQSGVKVLQEIEDLKGGLSDTIKAVAGELGIKPGTLSKALNIHFKSTLADEEEKMDTVRTLLEVTGNT